MENADPAVEPLNPDQPQTPEVAPTDTAAPKLSDELLQIPAMSAIFAGSPPAFSAPLSEFEKRPEAKLIVDHKDDLLKAGMGLYRSLDGQTGVIFNQLRVHGSDIQAADKAGQLLKIAPPFDVVNQAVATSGANHPALSAAAPVGAATPSAASATAMPVPPVAPESAGAQKKVAAARMKNAVMGPPTSGPAPGAGRLLNSILKPVL